MYIDSHAHLDDNRFQNDIDEIILEARKNSIDYIINPGADIASSKNAIKLSEKYEIIYAAVGVHPHDAKDVVKKDYDELIELSQHTKVVAIGEIGLDYYYNLSPIEVQKEVFIKQIEIAKEVDLPVIIHNRDAHMDTYKILKKYFKNNMKGVIHSFSGSLEMANQFLDLGLYISISGPITFKNAKKLPEIVGMLPLDRMLIETDSPYLTPVPNRGKRNNPSYVKFVAEKIAQIKNINIDKVAQVTSENAINLFGI